MYSSSSTQGDQTSGTFNGAKIYFCHTSRSALSTTFADNYSGNTPTLMLSRSALSMNWTMGQWNEIPLDETFAYNGTDNLLIEIQWTSSGSSLLAGATSPASQNALLGTYGASSGSTYYRSVFQLHYTTPVEPIVWHTDYQVDSGDGIVDPGETIAVSSWLRSVGTTANSLQATLSSTSGWCSVTQPNWSAGTMNMGATVDNSGSPFQIAVNADAPKGANLGLTLSLTANSGAYTVDYPLSVSVTPPIFELESYLINDFAGDGNLALNPDERVQLLFSITNSGSSASSVNAILTSSSPHVTIISDASPMGAMAKLGTGNNRSAPFAFLISTDAGLNREYPFSIRLSYDGGQSTDINLTTQPYTAPTAGSSTWIDTSGGTTLALGDESEIQTSIGFSFPYYHQAWSQVYVTDNGYIMFTSPSVEYENASIPESGAPNGIIAPLWDDFNPDGGGTIRCITVGNAPDRICAIEWNAVPHYNYGGALTFEILLHESGLIQFQYGAMSGTAANGASATIGIENYEGTGGVQHSFNQGSAVANGTCLTFDTAPEDSDADGLPDDAERFYWGSLDQTLADDDDEDGINNADEIGAWTDPADGNSLLCIEGSAVSVNTNMVIGWRSVPGQLYNVYSCIDPAGSWSNQTVSPCVGSATGFNQCTVTVDRAESFRFFKIGTE